MTQQTQPRPNRLRQAAAKKRKQQQPARPIVGDNQVATKHVFPAAAEATESASQSSYRMPDMAAVIDKYPEVTGIRPETELIPLISNRQLDALACSMKELGRLLEPIHLDRFGKLIGSRGELAACYLLGITPRFETTDLDPLVLVIASLARQHLTRDQLAATAVKLLAYERSLAAERQKRGLKRGTAVPVCRESDTPAGRASTIVARKLGLSRDIVERASKLPDDLVNQVADGKLRIIAAERILADQKAENSEAEPAPKAVRKARNIIAPNEVSVEQCQVESPAETAVEVIVVSQPDEKNVKQCNAEQPTKKVAGSSSEPKTLLNCEDVTVIQLPDQQSKLVIWGPVKKEWLCIQSDSDECFSFSSKADAIEDYVKSSKTPKKRSASKSNPPAQ